MIRGFRSWFSIFDNKEIIQLGDHCYYKMLLMEYKIFDLQSKKDNKRNEKKKEKNLDEKKKMKREIYLISRKMKELREKINNIKLNWHNDIIAFLLKSYNILLLPRLNIKFFTSRCSYLAPSVKRGN